MLNDIRVAVADALKQGIGGAQVSGYMLANPVTPCLHVFPDEAVFDTAMARGADTWALKVQAYVGFVDAEGAQRRLDLWIAPSGPESVKALVEADRTLGGLVHDVRVTDCSGYRLYTGPDGRTVLGAEWSLQVLASGT